MIRFTNHALLKLAQRKILRELVEETVTHPDYMFETYGGRRVVYKKFGDRFLKVVITEEIGTTNIVTQHWDSTFTPK